MLKGKWKEKPKHPIVIAGVVTVISLLVLCMRPLYQDVDNYFISLAANKVFAGEMQDGYIIHFHPLLCLVLEGLHALTDSADVFLMAAGISILFTIFVVSYVLADCVDNYFDLVGYYLVLFVCIIVEDLFFDGGSGLLSSFSAPLGFSGGVSPSGLSIICIFSPLGI